jgi:hypothetical protein
MLVRVLTNKYGTSAGKIWEALNKFGSLSKEKIIEITNLSDKEFYTGIGWLARENKIKKDTEKSYRLDKTNLTHEIGPVAGIIWKIIDIWDEVDIASIKKLSEADEKYIYSALGWLAREEKINEKEENIYILN